MFYGCRTLIELNLSNFNYKNVTILSKMFYRCLSLKELNFPDSNINSEVNTTNIFYGCDRLNNYNDEEKNHLMRKVDVYVFKKAKINNIIYKYKKQQIYYLYLIFVTKK